MGLWWHDLKVACAWLTQRRPDFSFQLTEGKRIGLGRNLGEPSEVFVFRDAGDFKPDGAKMLELAEKGLGVFGGLC